MDNELDQRPPRDRAIEAATSGRPEVAQAWALISIADSLAEIKRDLHHYVRRVPRG